MVIKITAMVIKSILRKKVRDISFSSQKEAESRGKMIKNFSIFPNFAFKNKRIMWQRAASSMILFFVLVAVTQNEVMAPIFFQSREVEALYDEERANLQKELEEVEKEIAEYEKLVATTQQEKAALQRKINELKNKAEKINLQIKSTNLNLQSLEVRIDDTTAAIIQTTDKINSTKNNLANLLQTFSQLNQTSSLEILLGSKTISEFFDYSNALYSIQEKILENIEELEELKITLNNQSQELTSSKEETQKLLAMQMLQRQELENTKKEQAYLLEVTQGNEAKYQQMLSASKQKATEIKNRIYQLIGVQTQVTFGEALDIANWVSSRTGVRPAFLLAILTQESNLGQNVGTCNRPGDPPFKSWRAVMKPDRDQGPFLQICQELGLNPDTTPVSCPMYQGGQQLGWGGAMGPAQFIPSTWMIYKDQVSQITGNKPANPWDIRDAFVAAALYLAKWGATQQTREAEWRAAMIYFSGSTNTKYRFYGDSVMAIADKYEQDISYLKQVAAR
ncbi:MAG: hypothetical protein PHF45_01475 [Candidatus Pacebacteria bacterium]|nr:hypothetical protein [Candidatus Paceibacterota bacterium]